MDADRPITPVDRVRETICDKRYSLRIGQCYVEWIHPLGRLKG